MVLNVLQCKGWSPQQRMVQPQMSGGLRSGRGVPVGEADTQADRRAAVCHTASALREWEPCEGINLVKWRGGHLRQRDQ